MGQTMGMDLIIRRDGGIPRSCLSRLAWVPIPVLLTAMGVFSAADWQRSHPSIHLLLIVNIVFTLLACLVVAYLTARSFLICSTPGLLLLGCGVVLWGPAGVVATAAARGDANISITIYNSCVWLSVLCHLTGVALSLRARRSLSPPTLWLVAGYACAAGAVALVALLALADWIPAFYVEERGATFMRQAVLTSAIGMCALAALLLGITRRRPLSGFAYWYALALLLIATGLLGVMLQTHHASVLGWTGRMTQALGALYLFIAAAACVRESRVWGMSLETALRESEGRYRTLFETAPDAIIVHRDGRFLRANDAALRLSGAHGFEELAGHGVLDFFRPQEREQAAARIRLALTGHPQPIREATLRRLDGREAVIELHTGPVDFQGAPAVQTILRDVTARKRAEEALRENQALMRAVMEGSPDLIYVKDTDGRVLMANPAARAALGRPAHEVIGKSALDFHCHDPEVGRAILANDRRIMGSGRAETLEEPGSDGRTYLSTKAPYRGVDGQVIGLIGISHDITERKQAEERARKEQRETAFANRVLRAFVEQEGDELFERALAVVQEEMASQYGVFGYIAEPGHLICPSLSRMLDACEVEGKCIDYPLDKWKGLWARALQEKRSLYANEAPPVPPGHPIIHNNLAAPILFHGEVIGLLNLANKEGGYREQDRETLDTIAARVAPVLYAWIQRKLRADERRRAEEVLKIKDSAIASSLSAIAMADLQGRLRYVNPAFLALWGYKDEREVLGRSVLNFWKEPPRAVEVMQAIQNGRGWVGELVAVTKDGTPLSLALSANTVRDDAGAPTCMMASFMDITERKRTEERLKVNLAALTRMHDLSTKLLESGGLEALLQEIVDTAVAVAGAEKGTLRLLAGDSLCLVAHHGHQRPFLEFFGSAEKRASVCGEAMKRRQRVVVEDVERSPLFAGTASLPVLRDAGVRAVQSTPLLTRHGTFLGVLTTQWSVPHVPDEQDLRRIDLLARQAADLIEHKQTEETLRESEERYRGVVQNTSAVIFRVDPQGIIRFANDRALEFFGYAADELIGKHAVGTIIPERETSGRDLAAMVEEIAENPDRFHSNANENMRKNGERVWMEWTNSGIYDADGHLKEFLAVGIDATERRKAEEALCELNATLERKVAQRTAELEKRTRQLQKLTLELARAEERERRRVAVVLHEDLQQQIAGAKFHLGLLNGRSKHESQQDVVQRVDAMLKEAIEKSRRLSYDLSPAVLHMNDLAEVLLWLAKQVGARHGLTVHVDAMGEVILQSETLTLCLFRAAQEALLNVVKHAGVKEATIRVRRLGPYVCLCISDTGRGFDLQQLKDTNGFGLLAIRERVELLGGRMKIRSIQHRGTAVRIVVPEVPENGASAQ